MTLSRSQVDAAGRRIRDATRRGEPIREDDLGLVAAFRATFLEPALHLQALVDELRSVLAETLGIKDQRFLQSAARPKTVEAIVAKLGRSATSLSTMQDIAGARLVVPTIAVQDGVLAGLLKASENHHMNARVKDTREAGDELGYRAIHVVVDWPPRRAEIQLRTYPQQVWAQLVERIDQSLETDLKHGDGPAAVQDWLRTMSEELRKVDLGLAFEFPPYPGSDT